MAALRAILRADPVICPALLRARDYDLPDWMIVSGAIYNTVWNALTDRPAGYGLRDIDLFYCDNADLSWQGEDRLIRTGCSRFADLPVPVGIRNQARVHLWYQHHFGHACPAYRSSGEALDFFAAKTQAVGVRLTRNDEIEVQAPFGLDPIFSFRLVGNPVLDNRAAYHVKGVRAHALWPELTLEPWPVAMGDSDLHRRRCARQPAPAKEPNQQS